MEPISIKQIVNVEQPILNAEPVLMYEVITEETRIDDAGNEYPFQTKQVVSTEGIDAENARDEQAIADIQARIDGRNNQKAAIANINKPISGVVTPMI